MSTLPIEIEAGRRGPLGMPPEHFLRDYWQKRPLLIRKALPRFKSPLTANDLAGLACEPGVLARIVLQQPENEKDAWQVESGPFAEERFAQLPASHWTLLVQDVDRWDADVRVLLRHFAFLPRWRIDDIMVSYAAPQGSVGAHVDHYDVFLLQGLGQRQWHIDAGPKPDLSCRDDAPIKLLQHFEASHSFVLEPGDMLYLPPQVPHHGVAIGECLTLSIGMRAPSVAELLVDWAEDRAAELDEGLRYTDPDLQVAREPGRIDAAAVGRLRGKLQRALDFDDEQLGRWFARYLSLYRLAELPQAPKRTPTLATMAKRFSGGARLHPLPSLRLCYRRDGATAWLAVAGAELHCSLNLARMLCGENPIDANLWQGLGDDERGQLRDMLGRGWLAWS